MAVSLLLCVVLLMVRHRSRRENASNGEVGDPDPACCCHVYAARAKFVCVCVRFCFPTSSLASSKVCGSKDGESQLPAAGLKPRERSALKTEF